jgi:hypothetical protein
MTLAAMSFVSVIAMLVVPTLAQQPKSAELARAITAGRAQNQMAMREYAWTSRTEIKVKGETKVLKTEIVRYTVLSI